MRRLHAAGRSLARIATMVAIVAAAACGKKDEAAPRRASQPVAIGAPAPAYSAVTLAHDSVSLAGQRGKVVLLNIWATWCHPCRQEIPVLEALYRADSARGLEIVGVSVDAAGEEQKIRAFAKDMGMTYPLWHDPDERVSSTFLAVGVPASYLIDRSGTLRWRKIGPIPENDPTLRRALDEALAAGTP